MTGEQERANLLHSLTEGELKEDTEGLQHTVSKSIAALLREAENLDGVTLLVTEKKAFTIGGFCGALAKDSQVPDND